MVGGPLGQALRNLRCVAGGPGDDQTDLQLLERYASAKDDEAFEVLVRRHGRMVLGVCRRVLGNDSDADDAFQATFLVLASKADSAWWRQSVGNWLYAVAYRISSKKRVERARRRSHEREASARRSETIENHGAQELHQILNEELDRLPEKFRMPLLLCCLQDQTIDEAARQLGWSFSTVKGRLQRGRELLRDRLGRRGVTLSVGVLAAILAEGVVKAVPPSLLNATIHSAATGTMTVPVAVLFKGAVQAMFWTKMKASVLVLTAISLIGLGGGLGTYGAGQSGQAAHAVPLPQQPPPEKKAKEVAQKDKLGVLVSVDLFSGRENPPAWALTPEQSEEFLKRFKSLPKADAKAEHVGRLGYRGMRLDVTGKRFAGIESVLVFNGMVLAKGVGQEQSFLDKDRVLEKWLVRGSKGNLDPDIFLAVAKELNIEK